MVASVDPGFPWMTSMGWMRQGSAARLAAAEEMLDEALSNALDMQLDDADESGDGSSNSEGPEPQFPPKVCKSSFLSKTWIRIFKLTPPCAQVGNRMGAINATLVRNLFVCETRTVEWRSIESDQFV